MDKLFKKKIYNNIIMFEFKHLEEKKSNYVEHFSLAMYYSMMAFGASLSFLIHAIYPDVFIHTGSAQISKLHHFLQDNQEKNE
jgi:Family of unknown function (DUF6356)